MTRKNALTKEQLTTTIELIDRMQQMGENIMRMEVNLGAGVAGELVREDGAILFVPGPPARNQPQPRDTYPYQN